MSDRVDTASLLSRVDIVTVIDRYVPLKKAGSEFEACCPFHTEDSPSFKVSPTKQIYHCFGCGANGDAISFLREHQGMSFQDAVEALGGSLPAPGVGPTAAPAPERKKAVTPWVAVVPAPADAPEPPKAHLKRRFPELTWCYRDGAGRVLGYVYRFRTSEGGKEVLPLVWARNGETGHEEWHWLAFPAPRPLYGLDRLAARPDATVLLTEGEKCADAGAAELPDLVSMSWSGGGKAAKKSDWSPLAGRKVVLWADADAKRIPLTKGERDALPDDAARLAAQAAMPLLPEDQQPGVKTMAEVAEILLGLGCRVWLVNIPAPGVKPDGWDIADAVAEGLTGAALADFIRGNLVALAPASSGGGGDDGATPPPTAGASDDEGDGRSPAWMRGMIWKTRGTLEDCRENVFLLLTQHPAWAGVVAWDDFARRVVKRRLSPTGGEPGEWTSEDDLSLGLWMAQRCRLLVKGEGTITSGVAMAANRAKFHPVREHLEGLGPWDGVERLAFWLDECLGATAGSSEYLRIVGRLFLVGLVARVMQPGIKWDYMPILEGPQGKGKSTALRILGGEWFADTPLRLGDKDSYMGLDGVWLYEVGEMDSFNRAETTAVKAFVTTQVDHYREPYARRTIDRPRQVAFAGTTNQGEYLKDTTGNRRFFPIRLTGHLDLDKLTEWRPQLLAEALHVFRSGARLYATREEEAEYIRPEQESREIIDPWVYKLQDWLDDPVQRGTNDFTSLDLLTLAIGMEVEKIDNNRGAATRLGNLMARLGWRKDRRSTGRREWIYVRPVAVVAPPAPAGRHEAGRSVDVPF
jgi:predicted P-loop ATPase